MGEVQDLSGRRVKVKGEEILRISKGWGKGANAAWTDRFRLGNGRVAATVVWWEEANTPQP